MAGIFSPSAMPGDPGDPRISPRSACCGDVETEVPGNNPRSMEQYVSTARTARQSTIQQLQQGMFDLLVIGGGINGAGIARDAAMRGLRVALVEKGDFASGTSSKSSKLIHGGVRYLQQGHLRLVRIASRERDLLRRRLAPHLVEPLEFVFPVYAGQPVGFVTLGIGMWLYDLLAVFRNIRAHRMLTPRRTRQIEPQLRSQGLRGAALYYDCWTDDARLTLETILAARDEGALVANYLEVKEFSRTAGRLAGVTVQDRFGGSPFAVRARCIVNATGPWVDRIRQLDDPEDNPCLRLTKGAHILVPRRRVGNTHAVVMHSPRDQRVLFVLPWGEVDIIGTTDTDFAGSPDAVAADDDDIAYLIESANWSFPSAHLTREDIISTYAGLRPLVATSGEGNPSAVSREEAILESRSGLISLAGGKLTTYRYIAEEIVDRVVKRLGRSAISRRGSRTATKPLPGGTTSSPQAVLNALVAQDRCHLSREQLEHLVRRYGSRAAEVIELTRTKPNLEKRLVPGLPYLWAEAEYAVEAEMALQPDDILMRRTKLGLKHPKGSSQVAEKMLDTLDLPGDSSG